MARVWTKELRQNEKVMKRFLLLLALATSTVTFGQYKVAIGLRGGETSGLTIKGFTGNSVALEGIIGVWYHGYSATLLFEKHTPLKADGLNLYYGGGLHAAFLSGKYYWYKHGRRHYYTYDDGVGIGVDGVLGLEYKLKNAPVAFSLDIKPYISFNTRYNYSWVGLDPGLGIKVTL